MNKDYWFSTPWLSRCKGLKKLLHICNKDLVSIEEVLKHEVRVNMQIHKSIKVIDLYLMDLYCFNVKNQPAFFISRDELSKGDIKVLRSIRSSSYLLIQTLLSSLYGDIEGRKQVDYLLKWTNMNLTLLSSIWNNYNLKDRYSLNRCEVDLYKVRETYLRCLSLVNGIGNKIDTNTTTLRLIKSDNLINNLLNN